MLTGNKNQITEFFKDIKKPTLYLSTCNAPFSGCHTFCSYLSQAEENQRTRCLITEKKIEFLDEIPRGQIYENIIFSGCLLDSKNMTPIVQTLVQLPEFSALKKIYSIAPPNLIDQAQLYTELPEYRIDKIPMVRLYSGMNYKLKNCIGLPPTLMHSAEIEAKHTNYIGLIYLPQLLNKTDKPAIEYLRLYFSQIKMFNPKHPHNILVITKDPMEQKLISEVAKHFKMTINFSDKLSQDNFIMTIKSISKNQGIIAYNGIMTFLEAEALGALTLGYSNVDANFLCYQYIVTELPAHLQKAASVILGLSTDHKALEDKDTIFKVHRYLSTLIKTSIVRFQQQQEIATPDDSISTAKTTDSVTLELKKLTGLNWKYDKEKRIATTQFSVPVYEKLLEYKLKAEEIGQEQAAFWNQPMLQLNLSKDEDIVLIQKLAKEESDPKLKF